MEFQILTVTIREWSLAHLTLRDSYVTLHSILSIVGADRNPAGVKPDSESHRISLGLWSNFHSSTPRLTMLASEISAGADRGPIECGVGSRH